MSRCPFLQITQRIAALTIFVSTSAHAQLDLHAHLDMKPGMGFMLRGDLDSQVESHHWGARFRTRGNGESLLKWKGPGIIVVSLYGHPYFSFTQNDEGSLFHFDLGENVRNALEKEYQHLTEFAKTHASRVKIVKNAAEAREAMHEGKIAIVLSIEGAAYALETEEDFKKWVDARGVAIVTPFHLTQDHFGGTAFMRALFALFNSGPDFLESLWHTKFGCLKILCRSENGISPEGSVMIQRLRKHKVWIDLAHANEIQIRYLVQGMIEDELPMLVTHTIPREWYLAERGLGEIEQEYVQKRGGIIGLMPTEDMILTPLQRGDCSSGLHEFKRMVTEMSARLGAEHVTIGSDVNAPLVGLSPECTGTDNGTQGELKSGIAQDGYYTYDQFEELTGYVAPGTDWQKQTINEFLKDWEKVRP